MKEKKISSKEVHWTLVNPRINAGEQANSFIRRTLPPDVASHFAKMLIGPERYIWKLDVDATPLSQVTPDVAIAARQVLATLKQRVEASIPDSRLRECVMTYPNDDYVMCYENDKGQVDIIITGWGFVNRKTPGTGVIVKDIRQGKKTQAIRIGFLYNEKLHPNHQFALNNHGVVNTLKTGNDGYCTFERPFVVGTQLIVTDLATQNDFPLEVTEGQEEYLFEVTIKCKIDVSVYKGGTPIPGCQITVEHQGDDYSLVTDEAGACSLLVTYIENSQVTVFWASQQQTQAQNAVGNTFIFEMEEKAELPEPKSARINVIDQNGIPQPYYPISIETNGGVMNLNTDDAGEAYTAPIPDGEYFNVRDGNNPDNYLQCMMSAEQDGYVLMVNTAPPPQRQARVRIVDSQNIFVTNVPVALTQQGMAPLEGFINGNGDFIFDKSLFIPDAPIQVQVNSASRPFPLITFAISNDEDDYLLAEEGQTPWWLILLEVLIGLGVAVGLFFLCKPYIAGAFGISDLVH